MKLKNRGAYPAVLVLTFLMPLVAAQQEGDKTDHVHSKQTTVVTVKGKPDVVETERSQQSDSIGGKIGNGLRTGLANTGRAIVGAAGWLLNVKDDIPSDREREKQAEHTNGR